MAVLHNNNNESNENKNKNRYFMSKLYIQMVKSQHCRDITALSYFNNFKFSSAPLQQNRRGDFNHFLNLVRY